MKILILIEGIAEDLGGPPLEAARLSYRLIESGHSVEVLTERTSRREVSFHKGVTFRRISNDLLNVPSTLWTLFELTRGSKIVIVYGVWGLVVGPLLTLLRLHSETLFYVKTLGMLQPYIMSRRPRLKKCAFLCYVGANLRHAAGVLVSSESEANIVKELVPSARVVVLPNGVALDEVPNLSKQAQRAIYSSSDAEFLVLYLGRLHPKKRCADLLLAVHQLTEGGYNLRVLIAGPDDDKSYANHLRSLASTLGLNSRVRFLGSVSGMRKWELLFASDVLSLPSESEGFSNSVLEAMACGTPVIITPGCNFPEIASDGAGKVVEVGVAPLRDALRHYIDNISLLRRHGIKARELIHSKFDWRILAESHCRVIRDDIESADFMFPGF